MGLFICGSDFSRHCCRCLVLGLALKGRVPESRGLAAWGFGHRAVGGCGLSINRTAFRCVCL